MKVEELRKMGPWETPMYLFDLELFRERVRLFRRGMGEQTGLCFAMKANPFLVGRIYQDVDRIEVCSMGEYRICQKIGIPPEKVLISGVLKKEEDLEEILEHYGSRCFYTAESYGQLRQLKAWGQAHGQKIRVYPRLTSGNQFGVDEEEMIRMLQEIRETDCLELQGIHYFSGTQKRSMKKAGKELEYLDDFLERAEKEASVSIKEVEYGPGFAVSYFENQEDKTQEDVEILADAIRKMRWQGKTTLEMGRALAATCGYYMTTVRELKQSQGKRYCLVDGGIHQINYDGQIRGMYIPKVQLLKKDPQKKEVPVGKEEASGMQVDTGKEAVHNRKDLKEWIVCGSLCTINDVLVQKLQAEDLECGDILVFERAGAYAMTEGMSLFLSHELPKVVIYDGEAGLETIREEIQTYGLNSEESRRES
ncbi:alanine racemase [Suipraeoptans intestinalis]|nr:alanine racemase [Suipraeoptans intestinalis]